MERELRGLDAELEAGLVDAADSTRMTVYAHVHIIATRSGEYSKTWLPRWYDLKKSLKITRCKKCPAGCTAYITDICPTHIRTAGYFSGANKQLTDAVIYHLMSLG